MSNIISKYNNSQTENNTLNNISLKRDISSLSYFERNDLMTEIASRLFKGKGAALSSFFNLLLRKANNNTGISYHSIKTFAQALGYSERHIKRAAAECHRLGLIYKYQRGYKTTNLYQINFDLIYDYYPDDFERPVVLLSELSELSEPSEIMGRVSNKPSGNPEKSNEGTSDVPLSTIDNNNTISIIRGKNVDNFLNEPLETKKEFFGSYDKAIKQTNDDFKRRTFNKPYKQSRYSEEIIDVDKYYPSGTAGEFLKTISNDNHFTKEILIKALVHSLKRKGITRMKRRQLNYMFFRNATRTMELREKFGNKFRNFGDRTAAAEYYGNKNKYDEWEREKKDSIAISRDDDKLISHEEYKFEGFFPDSEGLLPNPPTPSRTKKLGQVLDKMLTTITTN